MRAWQAEARSTVGINAVLVSAFLRLPRAKLAIPDRGPMLSRVALLIIAAVVLLGLLFPAPAAAHNVSKRDASFVKSNQGVAVAAFTYLGAKHMFTGYDHLAFLVGVIFFLYRMKDIAQYVSLFTIGHSLTLLLGVLG